MSMSTDVCVKCSDNFIVNNKTIECKICKCIVHAACVYIKDSWLKGFSENTNIKWLCDLCNEKWLSLTNELSLTNANSVFLLKKKVDGLSVEKTLLQKLVDSSEYTIKIQKSLINEYEEKLSQFGGQMKVSPPDLSFDLSSGSGLLSKPSTNQQMQMEQRETKNLSRSQPKKTNTKIVSGSSNVSTAVNKNIDNDLGMSKLANTKPQIKINKQTVNSAILHAQQKSLMQDIVTLPVPTDINKSKGNNDDWLTVKPKNKRNNRKFVVGTNEQLSNIQAVPKFISLHVSRLQPGAKPEDMKSLLLDKFPEVICEKLQSKHPQIYSSMKVSIQKVNLDKAWNKEIWPNGALVSRYYNFQKANERSTEKTFLERASSSINPEQKKD